MLVVHVMTGAMTTTRPPPTDNPPPLRFGVVGGVGVRLVVGISLNQPEKPKGKLTVLKEVLGNRFLLQPPLYQYIFCRYARERSANRRQLLRARAV